MRMVGIGKGQFRMLDGSSPSEIRRRPEFVDRAPAPISRKPTLMAQAAARAAERRRDDHRIAEDHAVISGAPRPAYRPAKFIDLVADECRWPIDTQGDLRCGAKQAPGPGQPYCALHRQMSRGSG